MTDKKAPIPIRGSVVRPNARDWHETFLIELAATCNVSHAAATAGVSRQAAYATKRRSVKFRAAWDEAIEEAMEGLVSEAYRRAKTSSDLLMIFLMKAHDPARYRDRYEAPAVVEEEVADVEPRRIRIELDTTNRLVSGD